jgi:hypothetical protein
MKYIALAMLLAVVQASAPSPRKTANTSAGGSQQQSTQDQDESHSPSNTNAKKTIVIRESTPVRNVGTDWWYRAYVIFTGALVIVGAVGIRYAIKTLKAIERQSVSMRRQTTHLRHSVVYARRSARAAKKSADAANVSADIAARVSIPTLMIETFELRKTGAASLAATLQCPRVNIVVRNCGQTPAFPTSWGIIFTTEELPDVPVYTGQPGCGVPLEKIIIKSGDTYTLPQLFFPRQQWIAVEDAQAITEQRKILVAYGYICYRDLFDNPLRRLKFCEIAINFVEGVEPNETVCQWISESPSSPFVGTDRPAQRKAQEQAEQAN